MCQVTMEQVSFSSCRLLRFVVLTCATISILSSFYGAHAQEFPKYTTPLFADNITHRQNVCERQTAFHNNSVPLRDALRGLELRCWLSSGGNNWGIDPTTGAISPDRPGLFVQLLDELAERAQFTWRNSFGISTLTDLGNRTLVLNEFLNWTIRTYDLSVAQWVHTTERINLGASFPKGWFDASIIMVGFKDTGESKLNVWSFLEPFDWAVWVLILVTFLIAGLVYLWMEWYNDDSDRQELGNKPTETIFFAALTFAGDIKFEPSTDYARLFTISLAFWSLLIASAYTANLASFLVVENTPSLQIESVGDAVKASLPMCVLAGSSAEMLVAQTHPGAIFVRKDPTSGEEELFRGVDRGECTLALTSVGAWDRYQRDSRVNGDCQLTWIGRVFKFNQGGFATLSDSGTFCTSLIRDVVNLHLIEMEEDGFLQDVIERDLELSADISCDAIASAKAGSSNTGNDSSDARLSIQEMGGLFIIFYAVLLICICMALFMKWHGKRRMSSRNRSESGNASADQEAVSRVESHDDQRQGDDHVESPNRAVLLAEGPAIRQSNDMLTKMDNIQRELEAMRKEMRQLVNAKQ